MKTNGRKNAIILLCFLTMVLGISGSLCGIASAEDDQGETGMTFADQIGALEAEGLIPATSGTYLYLGDYEDSLAQLGYLRKIPLMEAENFAASVHLSWESGSRIPDTQTAGCGIIFNSSDGSNDYMMASVRMDGMVYISGSRNYSKLSYGKFYYGLPAVEGSADLLVIVNDHTVSVFLDGNNLAVVPDFLPMGNEIGLGILSGTYQDFGTRCKFEDICFYIWQEDQE